MSELIATHVGDVLVELLGVRTVVADGGTLTIGRGASNGLVLADPRASRHHARLAVRGGLLVLTDLDSTNGTRVNGRSVRELAIGVGDEIRIGDSMLVVGPVDDRAVGAAAGDDRPVSGRTAG